VFKRVSRTRPGRAGSVLVVFTVMTFALAGVVYLAEPVDATTLSPVSLAWDGQGNAAAECAQLDEEGYTDWDLACKADGIGAEQPPGYPCTLVETTPVGTDGEGHFDWEATPPGTMLTGYVIAYWGAAGAFPSGQNAYLYEYTSPVAGDVDLYPPPAPAGAAPSAHATYCFRDATPASLTVIKHVVNDDGGTNVAADWTMYVSNGTPGSFAGDENGTAVSVSAGAGFVVTESTEPAGYVMTSEGDCSVDEVEAGGEYTCTITNDDAPIEQGVIRVEKQTVPGDSDAEFNFTGDTSGSLSDGDSMSLQVDPGEYEVTESEKSGWDLTGLICDDGDDPVEDRSSVDLESATATFDVQAGETVTCTFTNTQRGTIEIEKQTLPDDSVEEFQFTGLNDPAFSDGLLQDGDIAVWSVAPESYRVVETVPEGWDLTGLVCDDPTGDTVVSLARAGASLAVAPGETVHCTFANTQRGTIVIEKVTDPSDDPTAFGFVGEIEASLSHGGTAEEEVPAGGPYEVTEVLPTGDWVLTNIVCDDPVVGRAGPSTGNLQTATAAFYVDPGETVTCRFHNYRPPTGSLTVIKEATPGDGTSFGFGITTPTNGVADLSARAAMTFSLADGESETFPGPGDYVVSEDAPPAGWKFDGIDCRGTADWSVVGQTLNVSVGRDDTVVCYFYNSGYGHIIVEKQTNAGAPHTAFTFDPSWGANFMLAGGEQTLPVAVTAGMHSVAEVVALPEGWSLTSATCDDGSLVNAIGVSPGETVTCTFVNTYEQVEGPKGSITIIKDATARVEPDDTLFDFDGTLGTFQLADGGSIVFPELVAGDYTVSELLPEGWQFVGVECIATGYEVGDAAVTVSLAEGEAAQCTFFNEQEQVLGPTGSLTIIKQTVPSGGEGFSFDAGTLGTFTLDDGGSQIFSELEAGAYTVAEVAADGWAFAQVECVAGDWSQSGSSVTVDLAEGEVAVCTFTNGQLPYTGSEPFLMPMLLAGLWAVLMGLALVVWSWMGSAEKA